MGSVTTIFKLEVRFPLLIRIVVGWSKEIVVEELQKTAVHTWLGDWRDFEIGGYGFFNTQSRDFQFNLFELEIPRVMTVNDCRYWSVLNLDCFRIDKWRYGRCMVELAGNYPLKVHLRRWGAGGTSPTIFIFKILFSSIIHFLHSDISEMYTWFSDTGTGVSKTIQLTISWQAGVVNEPVYLKKFWDSCGRRCPSKIRLSRSVLCPLFRMSSNWSTMSSKASFSLDPIYNFNGIIS